MIAQGIDTNGDDEIQISEAENVMILNLNYNGNDPAKITSLEGIEFFSNLTELNCQHQELTNLDLTSNLNIEVVIAPFNLLTNVDVHGLPNLRELALYVNNIDTVNWIGSTALERIELRGNNMTSVNISELTNLTSLAVGMNNLTEIDLTNNLLLEHVSVYDNNIATVDVSIHQDLLTLAISDNPISEIDVSQNPLLWSLSMSNTLITTIDCSNTQVSDLSCFNNPNLIGINVQNGVISEVIDPFFPFNFDNAPQLRLVCFDEGEEEAVNSLNANSAFLVISSNPECILSTTDHERNEVTLYPNPVQDRLFIRSHLPVTHYELSAMTGQILISTSVLEDIQNTVVTLPSGIYFIRIQTATSQTQMLKFIKE